jgi:predicted outer membrane protein
MKNKEMANLAGNLRLKRALAAISLVVLTLSACSTGSKPVAPSGNLPVRPSGASPTVRAPLSPSSYFSEATAIDLFQLRAADIALQRGSGSARPFAVESRRQHQAISAQMSFAGRYLNLLPSRTLPPEYQQMLASLLSAPNFNEVYLAQEQTVCERALKLHNEYATRGGSPTLRPVAHFAAGAVASELQALGR